MTTSSRQIARGTRGGNAFGIAGVLRLACALCQIMLSLLLLEAPAAAAAPRPDLMVKLASEGDASYLGKEILEPVAQLQTRTDGALFGTPSVYRILLVNSGSEAGEFVVKSAWSGAGFKVEYLDQQGMDRSAELRGAGVATGPMAPEGSLWFVVRVTPTVETLGARCTVTFSAAAAPPLGMSDQVKMETVICGNAAAAMVSVPPDDTGLPGSVVSYPYTVTNIGSGSNSFALSLDNAAGWPTAIFADDGASGGVPGDGVRQAGESRAISSTGPLAPGQSYRFFVAVTVPPTSSDLAYSETRLGVTGEGAFAWDQVTTTTIAAAVTVAENVRNLTLGGPFAREGSAFPGDTLQYRLTVTNSGSVPAVGVGIDAALPVNMKYLPGTLWVGTASEGDGSPCPPAECGWLQESGGTIAGRFGQGATETAGGALAPGKTLHVFFQMQVE